QYDRTRLSAEPALTRAPANWVSETPSELLTTINSQMFALDQLRPFAATDLAQGTGAALEFAANVDRSLLPEILRLAEQSGIKLAFIRAQRRPTEQGPPPQSDALQRYVADLEAYLESRGVYFYDDWGDPDTPLSMYADGDHLNATGKVRYTERFAEKHARFFQ
ncbi:MAG TPA: hypothetical protein VNT81_01850, partial [Vicinamibacterales bacterium]|nr:hypothetical protein [Vicinamibacterales bacterium]